jgi:hypothetical protein
MIFGKFMAAVNYTIAVNGKISPSDRVATLPLGTGSRMLGTMDLFQKIQAMFHRQYAANCLDFSEPSWWLYRNNLLKIRSYNFMKACDV